MQAKKVVSLVSVLLLFSGFVYSVDASSTNTASFQGASVTVELTFPMEAHPGDNLRINATLTANKALALRDFTVIVKTQVNSSFWQEFPDRIEIHGNVSMGNGDSLPLALEFQLPQDTNGTLQCWIYVRTRITLENQEASFLFYITQVSEVTFSELRNLYAELSANYSNLRTDYEAILAEYTQLFTIYSSLITDYNELFGDYSELLANHSSLTAGYETLLDEHDLLLANYSNLLASHEALQSEYGKLSANYSSNVATHESLLRSYDTLSNDRDSLNGNYQSQLAEYNALETEYDSLNSTRYSVQASYDSLREIYAALNQTYTALETKLNDLTNKSNGLENAVNNDRFILFIFVAVVAGLVILIMYIKRKEPEPYVVIRKETVAVDTEEKQQPEQQQ